MDAANNISQSVAAAVGVSSDLKRPDKVYPYRLNFWADIMSEDNTSEIMNVLGMMLSMIGILLKYKTCAWFGVLVAAISYANVRSNHDSKQIMSTFLLATSSVVMCYLINPAPISHYIGQAAVASGEGATTTPATLDTSASGSVAK